MNFEFIKDLQYLHNMYDCCTNAELLVNSMPDNSLISSRKSAEAFARLIYERVHHEKSYSMNFINILKDRALEKYINNADVMNAFNRIRKKGNDTAHTLVKRTIDEAMSVLKDLHFICGTIAKKLNLIKDYPPFNSNIKTTQNVIPMKIEDIDEASRRMLEEYIREYIREESKLDYRMNELKEWINPIQFIPSYMCIHEFLSFDHKPVQQSTMSQIQNHFLTLMLAAKKSEESDYFSGISLSLQMKLSIEGSKTYTTTQLSDVLYGIRYDLPNAERFSIESTYEGGNPSFVEDPQTALEHLWLFEEIGERESFTYIDYEFHANSNGYSMSVYKDGKRINPEILSTTDILDKQYESNWIGNEENVVIQYDFLNYPNVLKALKEVVYRYLPEEEQVEFERRIEENDPDLFEISAAFDYMPLYFDCKKLGQMQKFFDEINAVIVPVMDQCKCISNHCWYQTQSPYAIAYLEGTDQGFLIKGTEV